MALLKLARMGHPVLRAPASPVDDPTAPAIARLIEDMIDTMADAPGIGLAAPQVHVPLRVIVFSVPPARAGQPNATAGAPDAPVPLTALINPMIEALTEEQLLGWEGCLSLPGLTGRVPRYARIRYRGYSPTGALIERLAEGFHARVVQHEADHLDGILYPQRMADLSTFGYVEEMDRPWPPRGERGNEAPATESRPAAGRAMRGEERNR